MDTDKLSIIEVNIKKVKKIIEDTTAIENFIILLEKEKYINISDGCDHLKTNCNLYELLGKDVVEILKEKLQRMRNVTASINENSLSKENLFQ